MSSYSYKQYQPKGELMDLNEYEDLVYNLILILHRLKVRKQEYTDPNSIYRYTLRITGHSVEVKDEQLQAIST